MSRVKVTCFQKDKELLLKIIKTSIVCPFNFEECPHGDMDCINCIEKNIEFEVIRKEEN